MPEEAVVTTNGSTVEDAARRRTVANLWRAGVSEPDIAKRVGTTVETVLEDLDAGRTERAGQLETDFDARREIVLADDQYVLLISVLEHELRRLDATLGAATLAKIKCAGQIAALIDARQRFLAETGLFKPEAIAASGRVMNAAEIQKRLKEYARIQELSQINPDALVTDGEREWLGQIPPEDPPAGDEEES
jgi:transposase